MLTYPRGAGAVARIAIRPRMNADPLIEERANLPGSHACVVWIGALRA